MFHTPHHVLYRLHYPALFIFMECPFFPTCLCIAYNVQKCLPVSRESQYSPHSHGSMVGAKYSSHICAVLSVSSCGVINVSTAATSLTSPCFALQIRLLWQPGSSVAQQEVLTGLKVSPFLVRWRIHKWATLKLDRTAAADMCHPDSYFS